MKTFNQFILTENPSSSLHGRTAVHNTAGHNFTINKEGKNKFTFYRDGKYVGIIHADSEKSAERILVKKGYNLK